MGARVMVAGASGYAGGELLRLLAGHPGLELGPVTAASSAGQPVSAVHPHLAGVKALAGRAFEPHDPATLATLGDCDLVFAALPAGQSAALAASAGPATRIVDLGPDFRLADPAAWARHYGGEHPGRWVTGLPELPGARARIRQASRVAAPGCYATAVILALAPLIAAGLVEPDDLVVVAASGTSGAGRSLRPSLLASEVMGAMSAYQVGGAHRHTAEIEQALTELVPSRLTPSGLTPSGLAQPVLAQSGLAQPAPSGLAGPSARPVSVSFTPMLAPMPRGILATCTARLAVGAGPAGPGTAPGTGASTASGTGPGTVPDGRPRPAPDGALPSTGSGAAPGTAELRAAIARAYGGEEFVCLLPEGQWPSTAAVAGSNGAQLQVAADERAGRAIVVVAIDNLGKGAAGQAVQNANLMLGLPETAGLTASGVAP